MTTFDLPPEMAARLDANPYRHDHEPLNSDFHGGICPACEWSNESTWQEDDQAESYDEQVNEHGNVIDYGPQFGEEA